MNMNNLTRYEIKKMLDKKSILIILLLLAFNVLHIINLNYDVITDGFYQGKQKLVDEVSGKITVDKVSFIKEGMVSNQERVEQGLNDPLNGNEGTYTGYYFGDMNAFSEIYKDMERIYNYDSLMKNKVEIIRENSRHSGFNDSVTRNTLEDMDNRIITQYYDTYGLENYFSYNDSLIFVGIIIMYLSINYLYFDQSYEMNTIVGSTVIGKSKYHSVKRRMTIRLTLIASAAFLLIDLVTYSVLFNIKGWHNPIYSLPSYQYSYFNISILFMIFIQGFEKIIILVMFSIFIYLISKFVRSHYQCGVFALLMLGLLWLNVFSKTSKYSYLKITQTLLPLAVIRFSEKYLLFISVIFLLIMLAYYRFTFRKMRNH